MCNVSVIIPAYNAEKYIRECLDSVVNQTLKDIEIIVINDGSTDSTGKIIDEEYSTYQNVIRIHQENRGLYATRKVGLSIAKGDYIGWVDADDYIAEDMFEKLYHAAVNHNSDLAMCDYEWVPYKSKMKEKWFRPYKGKKDVSFVERNSQPWNKIVKRSLLEKLHVGDYFETCFDEIYIRVLIHAENPITITEKLYFYRMLDNSMSSSYKNPEHYIRFIDASVHLRTLMKEDIKDSDYWQKYFDYRILYYRLMTMIVAANANDKETYQIVKRDLQKDYSQSDIGFCRHIMNENFGILKSFVIEKMIPVNYKIAHLICHYTFR